MKLFYYSGLQVQFTETITQLMGVLSIFMAHEFSFMACQHDVCPKQKNSLYYNVKEGIAVSVVSTFMFKKVYLGFS